MTKPARSTIESYQLSSGHAQRVVSNFKSNVSLYEEVLFAEDFLANHQYQGDKRGHLQKDIRTYASVNPLAWYNLDAFFDFGTSSGCIAWMDNLCTVQPCMYFYHTAKVLGLLEAPWEDMDQAISIVGVNTLFRGSPPTTLEACLSNLRLVFPIKVDLGTAPSIPVEVSLESSKTMQSLREA